MSVDREKAIKAQMGATDTARTFQCGALVLAVMGDTADIRDVAARDEVAVTVADGVVLATRLLQWAAELTHQRITVSAEHLPDTIDDEEDDDADDLAAMTEAKAHEPHGKQRKPPPNKKRR